METRANYLMIGSFVLVVVVGLFVFVIWLARVDVDRRVQKYDILFRDSVAGLGLGGDVRYRGIKVGKIDRIAVDPEDPGQVRVVVQISADNPIHEGDEARLELQGITGIAYINIEGAIAGSPLITAREGEARPVIPSSASQIEKLFQGAPDLVARGIVLADRAARLFDERNLVLVNGILADVKSVTDSLASRRERLENIIDSLSSTSTDVSEAARSFRRLSTKLDGLLDQVGGTLEDADRIIGGDAAALFAELRTTSRSINGLIGEAREVIGENREGLITFSNDGLPELSRFLTEARLLVASLSRVTERLESEGARFLLGEQEGEFKAK